MKWTHARPIEPGMYYVSHLKINQTILELWMDGDGEMCFEDPNGDQGYEYLEMPDDTLYCGPFHMPPINFNPEDD